MDTVVGIFIVIIGLFLCFSGRWALRFVLALWGAFAGFAIGVAIVDLFTSSGLLQTTLSWIVGLILAVVLASIAYLYFAVAVLVSMASIGYVIGVAIASAIGASANWILVVSGIGIGLLLGLIALVANLPLIILIVTSALAGASLAISGLLLTIGAYTLDTIEDTGVLADEYTWWRFAVGGLAIIGIIVQSRSAARETAYMRDAWTRA